MTGQLARRLLALLVAVLVAAGFAGYLLLGDHGAHASDQASVRPPVDTAVTILLRTVGRPIPAGFVGLSLEYPAVAAYAGSNPSAVNPVLEQLIRNLAPGQAPVLRIGGDSTDTTWWPTRHAHRSGGLTYSLSPRWAALTGALARAVGARLILGLDLEAGQPAVAVAEARGLLAGIGARTLRAFEIGNEAPRYRVFPWYHTGQGRPVLARSTSYDFRAFNTEFANLAPLLPRSVPVAGPTLGGPDWMVHLRRFLRGKPRLGLVTFHSYPLNRCFTSPGSSVYPTVARLLSASSSRGLARGVARYVAIAHERRLPFRLDEINSVACGGKRGVSNTFASALWALDSLFAMARVGVDGVNVHTFPGASYQLFNFRRAGGHWSAVVRPEYYGLLMFAQAAPPGSRLLHLRTTGSMAVRAWSTRAPDGTIRAVLINDDLSHRHVVAVRPPMPDTAATVIRLTAPSAHATGRVALAGQTFGVTHTGSLTGPARQDQLAASAGRYELTLPAASATMLTLRHQSVHRAS